MPYFLSCNSTSVVILLYTNVSKQLIDSILKEECGKWGCGDAGKMDLCSFLASTCKDAHGLTHTSTHIFTQLHTYRHFFVVNKSMDNLFWLIVTELQHIIGLLIWGLE